MRRRARALGAGRRAGAPLAWILIDRAQPGDRPGRERTWSGVRGGPGQDRRSASRPCSPTTRRDPGRAPRPGVRLLPPGPGDGGPGAAYPPAGRGPHRPRDRARPPWSRRRGAAARPRQAQDPRRRIRSERAAREQLPERIDGVLPCSTSSTPRGTRPRPGRRCRDDVAEEAIRLAELLHGLMPDEAEPAGPPGADAAHHARREGAPGAGGTLVLLADQDRSLLGSPAITAERPGGRAAVRRPPGRYAWRPRSRRSTPRPRPPRRPTGPDPRALRRAAAAGALAGRRSTGRSRAGRGRGAAGPWRWWRR